MNVAASDARYDQVGSNVQFLHHTGSTEMVQHTFNLLRYVNVLAVELASAFAILEA